jgi:antitoxin (DNA-binding transcriptional repressor) of toxin-antitoxin stability system
MRKTISATEAVRNFSDLLNMIRFRGESYTIERGGKPVASFGPAAPPVRVTLKDLPGLLSDLPSLGPDAKSFARDVRRGMRKAPGLPKRLIWP